MGEGKTKIRAREFVAFSITRSRFVCGLFIDPRVLIEGDRGILKMPPLPRARGRTKLLHNIPPPSLERELFFQLTALPSFFEVVAARKTPRRDDRREGQASRRRRLVSFRSSVVQHYCICSLHNQHHPLLQLLRYWHLLP